MTMKMMKMEDLISMLMLMRMIFQKLNSEEKQKIRGEKQEERE